ncbi:MAG: glycosyltransferase family 2 protein [Planctomycetes bacterium]|nr:glycosyltransferase family 2 protein [Planctomycetota bacterium]
MPGSLSILVPVFNEERNVGALCSKLLDVLDELARPFEIILVNDGSEDGSLDRMRQMADLRDEIRILDLRRNYGQTAAMMAAIDHASGDILIPIDSDLQNDPADIPELLVRLEEGYDVVSGWRRERKDAFLSRALLSRIANRVISWISGVHLRDYGCTLKAYRRDVLKDVRLYGESHRFIPIYASWMGARVTEIPVRHHPRVHGESKYGLERIFKVLLDIMVVKFLDRHFTKPIYVFGGFGLLAFAGAIIVALAMAYLKIAEGTAVLGTPLPLIGTMLVITSVMCILLGLIAEMLVRTYFESQQKSIYLVREAINMREAERQTTDDLTGPREPRTDDLEIVVRQMATRDAG